MTTYEVWRFFGYNRKTDTYEHRVLVWRGGDSSSAMFFLGRLTGLLHLSPHGPVNFNACHVKRGMEFLDEWGEVEYWCVIEK